MQSHPAQPLKSKEKMDDLRPRFVQRLFADDRPYQCLMAIGAVTLSAWTAFVLVPTLTLSLWSIDRFIFLMLVAVNLGVVLALFPFSVVLIPLIRWAERRNGAPFQEGDEVVILSRRFPDRIGGSTPSGPNAIRSESTSAKPSVTA